MRDALSQFWDRAPKSKDPSLPTAPRSIDSPGSYIQYGMSGNVSKVGKVYMSRDETVVINNFLHTVHVYITYQLPYLPGTLP